MSMNMSPGLFLLAVFLHLSLPFCKGGAPLVSPVDISSGTSSPSTWSLTLTVEAHRHQNDQIAFNTRAYCWNGVCSVPGPTIHVRAGDNFTLTIVNNLGPNPDNSHVMNTMNSPNTTNFHTHGLHIDPNVDDVFLRADPGESLVYDFRIPAHHGSGMMWYHDHVHGSST
jgi:FtsP/CotA-like multicopper oxidase with cupredoxin domain